MQNIPPIIRDATDSDIPAMLAIYSSIVDGTAISLELEAPSTVEFHERVQKYQGKWAWIVLEHEGKLLGYAYGSPHRERLAYRWSVETSVYVCAEARGQGVGTALYVALFSRLSELGYCNAFAVIVLPNEASVAMHKRAGFSQVGVLPKAGRKFGSWYDVGWFHATLRDQPPEE